MLTPTFPSYVTEPLEAVPALVVMMTTPLAPLAPYIDVAAASLSTSMLSMSEGFTSDGSTSTTPSITYIGSLPAFMEPIPRILKVDFPPGLPEKETLRTPATFPARLCITLNAEALSVRTSLFTEATEEESSLLIIVPYPTATASSRPMDSIRITTLTMLLPASSTSSVSMPRQEKFRDFVP